MPDESLTVLTCASGKQCTHLIPHLLSSGSQRLRLVVHRPESQHLLSARHPGTEVVLADLTSADDCARIVAGATTIFHLSPPLHPFERQIGFNMIDAAVADAGAGKRKTHFVLSSAIWSQLSSRLLHHGQKREVEESLIEASASPSSSSTAGLTWTILAPTHFIDLIPAKILASQDRSVFLMMWDPRTPMSFLTLADFAEIAAKVIGERDRHFYAYYPLVGTEPVTYTTVLEEMGRVMGKEVEVRVLSFEDSVKRFMQISYGDEEGRRVHPVARASAEMMLLHYRRGGLVGNPGIAGWLLGRKAEGYREWVRRQVGGG